tara:strand:- start:238 stop:768 length:531 start_codon:yes stop_codon:yes gene_type:complete
MQEVIFIIGLPGSGKSTLIEHYKSHPFIDYKIYDDWMTWTRDDKENEFIADVNYKELLKNIKSGNNVIVSAIRFCSNEFLHKSEYYLKSQFPNLNIKRIYFENDPIKSELNIRYRDKINGGYWEPNEEGVMWYFGTIFENIPLYRIEIQRTKDLSPNYIIPKGSTIFPIVVQQTDS